MIEILISFIGIICSLFAYEIGHSRGRNSGWNEGWSDRSNNFKATYEEARLLKIEADIKSLKKGKK